MSPAQIIILLHYYARQGDFVGEMSPSFVRGVMNEFVKTGLLAEAMPGIGQQYVATEATKVYVEALCNVPMPVQKWVIPTEGRA